MRGELGYSGIIHSDVECQYDFFRAIGCQPLAYPGRLHDGETADDYASNSRVEPGFELRFRAYPATDLNGQIAAIDDGADDLLVFLPSRPCAIEIDDMQVAESHVLVATRERNRVIAVDSLAIKIALKQAYALSLAKVDGRNNVHDAKLAKLLRSFDPASAERSG